MLYVYVDYNENTFNIITPNLNQGKMSAEEMGKQIQKQEQWKSCMALTRVLQSRLARCVSLLVAWWNGVFDLCSFMTTGGMRTRNSFSDDGYKKDLFLSGITK